jgi:hypothetical protein
MAASVVHFGTDECNRILVLRSVGYSVDACPTLTEFRCFLQREGEADAVLVPSRPAIEVHQVVTLTRKYSHARLVLFEGIYSGADVREFDLVIPLQMGPEEWLRRIAAVIEQSRALNAKSTAIRDRSAQLIKESEIVRKGSIFQRARSARERATAEKILDEIRQNSDLLGED